MSCVVGHLGGGRDRNHQSRRGRRGDLRRTQVRPGCDPNLSTTPSHFSVPLGHNKNLVGHIDYFSFFCGNSIFRVSVYNVSSHVLNVSKNSFSFSTSLHERRSPKPHPSRGTSSDSPVVLARLEPPHRPSLPSYRLGYTWEHPPRETPSTTFRESNWLRNFLFSLWSLEPPSRT